MRKILIRHSKLLALALAILVAFPISVLAIADPDSPPQVSAVYVYEDLLTEGDAGVLIDYYLDYSTSPNSTATEAFLGVFVDIDGVTQLKSVAPYTFVTSGYGRGLMWLYFTSAEVTTLGIDSANESDYEIWLVGNPALAWTGDPPKTIAGVDFWQTSGDTATLLALRVLYYADLLELIWALDLIEVTALGNRLTTVGASYFENVIPNLRDMAPAAFSSGEFRPVMEDLDYSTSFGAVLTNATGNVTGSPITLISGNQTVTVTAAGTFTLMLSRGTSGNVTAGTGAVTGDPVDIVFGTNTITVPGGGEGTLIVTVNRVDTETRIIGTIIGTALDLTTVAAQFGMTRWMFSGLVWLVVTIIICAGTYRVGERERVHSGGKVVMIVFVLCSIGGIVLGLMHPLVGSLLFIGNGAFTGYVLFLRGESLHKNFMFMVYMFVIVSIAGNVMQGQIDFSRTRLTADITDSANIIPVASTEGFPDTGIIVIRDERIAYASTNSTAFRGNFAQPLLRGAESTEAISHLSGERVSTVQGAMMNTAASYHIAVLADAAGLQAFLAMPVAFFQLIGSFFFLPLGFLGTDLQILTVFWAVIGIGVIVTLVVSLAGGRRV